MQTFGQPLNKATACPADHGSLIGAQGMTLEDFFELNPQSLI